MAEIRIIETKNKRPINKDGEIIYTDGNVEIFDAGTTQITEKRYYESKNIESIVLPESVTTIAQNAFSYCKNLKNVFIPRRVFAIAGNPFLCSEEVEVTVAEENIHYKSNAGNLYTKDGKKIIAYIPKESEKSFTLPEGISVICEHAFAYCKNLTQITLPESLTAIEDSAFWSCDKIKELTIPGGVKTIGFWAFYWCYNMRTLKINEGVEIIDDSAFRYCKNLVSVTLPRSIREIRNNAFLECSSLTDIYYGGSRDDWKKIAIGKDNKKLTSLFGGAKIHYNSK